MFEEMIATAEEFYQSLGIPYHIVNIVSGTDPQLSLLPVLHLTDHARQLSQRTESFLFQSSTPFIKISHPSPLGAFGDELWV